MIAERADFEAAVAAAVAAFPNNRLCRRLDAGALRLADYHALLRVLFHQTFEGPATFALAGAHCGPRHAGARAYLLAHADEEKDHWQWLLEDLRSSGDAGPDPRQSFPHPACSAYIAFNFYAAVRQPLGRLGIAAVLEGIGAEHGTRYGRALLQALGLEKRQAKFFLSHGALDVGHVADVLRCIEQSEPTPEEWGFLAHAATVGGALYCAMYDAAADARPAQEGER